MQSKTKIRLANGPFDYQRLNLRKGIPEAWEDGFRTKGEARAYEWWYFDARPKDQSTIVVIFYTKKMTEISSCLSPLVSINIQSKDGTRIFKEIKESKLSRASTKSCDVRIGKNYIRGNLQKYECHIEDNELKFDMKISTLAKGWRPKTGFQYFGDKGDYFAWLVAIPKGQVEIKYTYKNVTKITNGFCYHDHNWGNASLVKLIDRWCWLRANIGPYTIVAAEIVAKKKYDGEIARTIYISKNGKKLTNNEKEMRLFECRKQMNKIINRPISENLLLKYKGNKKAESFQVLLTKEGYVSIGRFIKGEMKRRLLKLMTGFDGVYLRAFGTANLKKYRHGSLVKEYSSQDAIWDFIFF